MKITSGQLRAARSLLDWTQDMLAAQADVSVASIKNFERGVATLRQETEDAIMRVLDPVIEFQGDRGVALRDDALTVLRGDNCYTRMLDDVWHSLASAGSGEALFFCSDDSTTYEGELDSERRLRASGIRFRSLIKEGNHFTNWPKSEYRWIPARYFTHNLQVIYADKVAQVLDGGKAIIIIRNRSLAETDRNKFNLIWENAKPLEG